MRYCINPSLIALVAIVGVTAGGNAAAGITLFEEGARYAKVGGRIQAQYRYDSPEAGASTDDLFFRRLRFYIEGSASEDWKGKWQVDFGKDGSDPAVKDAYIAYTGRDAATVTVGNHYVPFSREALTSSKRQQLVERTFTGDHNFGVPDRQMGVSLSGGEDIRYTVGWYQAGIDPSTSKLDFASGANDSAEYFGNMFAGRIDFYPNGVFKMAQGSFDSEFKYAVGASAFSWSNDDDNVPDPLDPEARNPFGDYDSITGAGVDGAIRMGGLSVDAGYNTFTSETRGAVTDGLVVNGEGDFDTWMLEAGYMLVGDRLEGVVGYQSLDADAYAEAWNRTSAGLNLFFNGHNDKLQLTWEMSENRNGVVGSDGDTVFVQWQHAF